MKAKAIFSRECDFYKENLDVWKKAAAALNGGRNYLKNVLKKHPSETEDEHKARVDVSYNINLIKYSTGRFGDYIFSKPPRRENVKLNIVQDFDRRKAHADSVMRTIFDYHTIFSLVWVFVDMPEFEGNLINVKTKEVQKVRPYVRVVPPMAVPDWSFNEVGELDWVILSERVIEKSDPFMQDEEIERRILYTKHYWQRFEKRLKEGVSYKDRYTAYPPVPNQLGRVPVIPYSELLPENIVTTPKIADILTVHDAVLFGESELLTNILKQTYGQLVLPASTRGTVQAIKREFVKRDGKLNEKVLEDIITQQINEKISRTKAIIEGEDERGTARYIQPTGANVTSIILHNDRLVNLIMKLYGFLVGVHTTQRESAESKSVDNISLSSQLTSIANKLQELENQIWEMMNEFDTTVTIPDVEYNTDFDIHELRAIIASIVELVNINCGPTYNKQLMKTATHILNSIHHIPDEDYEKIVKEIKEGIEAKDSIKFEDNAKHHMEKSGNKPDNIDETTDHHKSERAVGKTASIS